MLTSSRSAAGDILGVVPLVMRTVRAEMRRFRGPSVSVPQWRALGYVHRHAGTSLSEAGEHLGLTLPATSRLMDGLVERKLVMRRRDPEDRRCVRLEASARGRGLWLAAREFTQAALAERLSALRPGERAAVSRAMAILRQLFASAGED